METGKKVYIDANVFVAAGDPSDANHHIVKSLFEKFDVRSGFIFTSALTLDEIVFVCQKYCTRLQAVDTGFDILENSKVFVVAADRNILYLALHLMKETSLQPRDAIHLASALTVHADFLVTSDTDFAKIESIKVVSPKEALRLL